MMRTLMTFASILMLWTCCGPISAQLKEPALAKGDWMKPIVGRGETEESAKKDALLQAAKVVTGLMKQNDPPLQSFVVTEDYVRQLLANPGRAGEDVNLQLPGIDQAKQWIVNLRTDRNWWKDIVRNDAEAERRLRTQARQHLSADR